MTKEIKKILIKTKKAVFSQQIGNNTSKFKGEGYDFVELREYETGEDIRKIDWVITAKQQKPFVKVFHTQRELNINIIPILGGSVYFGTVRLKQELIAEIASIIGYSCAMQGDNYSSFIINENISLNTKKTKKVYGVDKMVENIYNYDSLGKKVDYNLMENQLFKQMREKSIIFLIGDFFNIDNLNLKLLVKKHEVIVIIVRDRFEEKPAKMGDIDLKDPTSNQIFSGEVDKSLIAEYEKRVKINDYKLYENLKKSNIEFIKIYTDENPIIKILKLFK